MAGRADGAVAEAPGAELALAGLALDEAGPVSRVAAVVAPPRGPLAFGVSHAADEARGAGIDHGGHHHPQGKIAFSRRSPMARRRRFSVKEFSRASS